MKRPLLIVAGGTGGHMIPALALARNLQSFGHSVIFYTDSRGLKFISPSEDLIIKVLSLKNRYLFFKFSMSLGLCFFKTLIRAFRSRPQFIVGFGGYPTLVWGLVAGLLRIPLFIHEQNAFLGRTNRLLARWSCGIAYTFNQPFLKKKETITGLPLRPEFKKELYHPPHKDGLFRLLIVGGSQGAKIFSEVLPPALALLPLFQQQRLNIVQQCREVELEDLKRFYQTIPVKIHLCPFILDIAEQIKNSHLIIARAGASTVVEITTIGRPTLFVPYAKATDDHQTANAKNFIQEGGGWLFSEEKMTPQALAHFLSRALDAPATLLLAAENLGRKTHTESLHELSHLIRESISDLLKK